jgi:hypothetical protein
MAATNSQKGRLHLAASAVWPEVGIERQPEELGLAEGGCELALRECPSKVGQGAGWGCDGDAEAARDLTPSERARAVNADALASPTTCPGWDRDMRISLNRGWGRWSASTEDAPELRGAGVAQNRALPAGEHGRHPPSRLAQSSVPNREHPTMNAMEVTGAQSTGAPLAVDPGLIKLLKRDHAVLPCRDPGDHGVGPWVGAFCMHGDA